MTEEDIRDILRSVPAILVIRDGEPSHVITRYDAWRSMTQGEPIRVSNGRPGHLARADRRGMDSQETQVLERLNKEILSLREQIQMQEDEVADGGSEQ